ncbi:MAG: hypothetical protein ACRDYY_07715 [Acidimicrobiales bacterium]
MLDLDLLVAQIAVGGLEVEDAGCGVETVTFADIGALAWYLRMVPWAVPGLDIALNRTGRSLRLAGISSSDRSVTGSAHADPQADIGEATGRRRARVSGPT